MSPRPGWTSFGPLFEFAGESYESYIDELYKVHFDITKVPTLPTKRTKKSCKPRETERARADPVYIQKSQQAAREWLAFLKFKVELHKGPLVVRTKAPTGQVPHWFGSSLTNDQAKAYFKGAAPPVQPEQGPLAFKRSHSSRQPKQRRIVAISCEEVVGDSCSAKRLRHN